MSESPLAVRPEVHYFAGPQGYIFEATYTPNTATVAQFWNIDMCGGALALEVDERAPVMSDAAKFAREEWPNVGGTIRLDHKGHRA